jgi:carbamoyl-phosphate synthase small subunit
VARKTAYDRPAWLVLEDGSVWPGTGLGGGSDVGGEVVFTTGMVGYVESLTDPSYAGQILVFTSPLIGNYGVPAGGAADDPEDGFESSGIQVRGVVVSSAPSRPSHHRCTRDLHSWLAGEGVPGMRGVDTRALVMRLRSHGTMPGRIVHRRPSRTGPMEDPLKADLVPGVSRSGRRTYGSGSKHVALVDCGLKRSILRALLSAGLRVTVMPWDVDAGSIDGNFSGVVLSNGPGDPERCVATIATVRELMERGVPILGICLGNQIMALAAGARTYKLPFGHRSQNQPVRDLGTGRCYVTSQNHGFAVDRDSLPARWEVWFENLNDATVEGIRHRSRPLSAVQFHPEARPGPEDTAYLITTFVRSL